MAAEVPGQQDVVVEDGDDTISYSPNQWQTFNNSSIYHGGTEHASYNVSATAVLSFTGSYVWVFSDFNNDHGRLSVSIDGGAPQTLSSFSSTYKPATQALFGQAVDAGSHILTVTNLDDHKAVGLDFFQVRPLTDSAAGVNVAATDAQVSYSSGQWRQDRTSYKLTYSGGDSVSFTFEGSSISYISDKNNDHGRFQVSLDGGSGSVFSSYSPVYQDAQVLFTASVTPGKHTITVTNLDDGKAVGLEHFAFVAIPAPPPGQAVSPSSPPPLTSSEGSTTSSIVVSPTEGSTTIDPATSTDSSSSLGFDSGTANSTPIESGQSAPPQSMNSSKISTGVIVGAVLASLAVVLFGILFVIMFRRRTRRTSESLLPVQQEVAQPWSYSQPVSDPRVSVGQVGGGPGTLPSYTESESQARGSDGGAPSPVVSTRAVRVKS